MNRRDFLYKFGLISAASFTPKFIFDLGANKHRYHEYMPFISGIDFASEEPNIAFTQYRIENGIATFQLTTKEINKAFLNARYTVDPLLIDAIVQNPWRW